MTTFTSRHFKKTNLKNGQNNVLTNKVSFGSATRTRTGVYGVRGRCPRPLDDSTKALSATGIEHARCFVPRKRVQKYCLFLICANFDAIFLRFFFGSISYATCANGIMHCILVGYLLLDVLA